MSYSGSISTFYLRSDLTASGNTTTPLHFPGVFFSAWDQTNSNAKGSDCRYLNNAAGSSFNSPNQSAWSSIANGASKTFGVIQYATDAMSAQSVGAGSWTIGFDIKITNAGPTATWAGELALYLINGSTGTNRLTIINLAVPPGSATGRFATGSTTVYSTTFASGPFSITAGDYFMLEIGYQVTNNTGSAFTPSSTNNALDSGTVTISSDLASNGSPKSFVTAPQALLFPFTYIVSSGGITVGNSATVKPTYLYPGTGNVALGGVAAIKNSFAVTAKGAVSLSNSATAVFSGAFTRIGSGFLTIGNTADVLPFYNYVVVSGNLALSNTAGKTYLLSFASAGNVALSDSANVLPTYLYTPSNGLTLTNSADNSAAIVYIGTGGLTLGNGIYFYIGNGNITAGNASDQFVQVALTTGGNVALSNGAITSLNAIYFYTGTGGEILSNGAIAYPLQALIGGGQLAVGNSATGLFAYIRTGRGGLSFKGTADVATTRAPYAARGLVALSGTAGLITHYKVAFSGSFPIGGIASYKLSCRTLAAGKVNFSNSGLYTFIPFNYRGSKGLALANKATAKLSYRFSAQGGLALTNQAKTHVRENYLTASGKLTLANQAVATLKFKRVAQGSITITGAATYSYTNNYIGYPVGGLTVGNRAGKNVIFKRSGNNGMVIGNTAKVTLRCVYRATGAISLNNSASSRQLFKIRGSGHLAIGNKATYAQGQKNYVAGGHLTFSGKATYALRTFVYAAGGSVALSNAARCKLIYTCRGLGRIAINIHGLSAYQLLVRGRGGLSLHNRAVAIPLLKYTGSGHLTLSNGATSLHPFVYRGSGRLSVNGGSTVAPFVIYYNSTGELDINGVGRNSAEQHMLLIWRAKVVKPSHRQWEYTNPNDQYVLV